ncbi:MAG: hypothetical protein CLLPBCKN_006549 [Chroococcidiopsis cubana SAG 39.79]|uniref:Uncharacterized protein n=1 Tax=Chroococcidiopsis cubana SAG 39.79 TaxID=388085 RepID=A0AB37UA59_9CYAN|nr:hypothetical protein [Chroococcidiopsis cubana]MDZ4877114.1 hypothetical protein [Chroococcidiopsis cubana SAG 39.79]RUT01431.1 hypothetical protein DSM107010_65250 [Chroococcidiopsis cubana SAG 39.79]
MPRDTQGKFALKNDEHRCVRSLRLTDTTWRALGEEAESLSLTRADYLEQIFRHKPYSLPSNTRIKKEDLLSNTHGGADSQPSNTWQTEQIEQQLTQLTQQHEENTFLLAQIQKFTQVNALEEMRDQILTRLKLGKQAPGYKKAVLALNQFIQLLRDKFPVATDAPLIAENRIPPQSATQE